MTKKVVSYWGKNRVPPPPPPSQRKSWLRLCELAPTVNRMNGQLMNEWMYEWMNGSLCTGCMCTWPQRGSARAPAWRRGFPAACVCVAILRNKLSPDIRAVANVYTPTEPRKVWRQALGPTRPHDRIQKCHVYNCA